MVTIRVKKDSAEYDQLTEIVATNVKFPFDSEVKMAKCGTVYYECRFSDYDYRNNKEAMDAVDTEIEGVKASMKERINRFLNKPGTLEIILGEVFLVVGTAVIGYICYSNGIEHGKILGVQEGYEQFKEHFTSRIEKLINGAYDIGMDCLEKDIRDRVPDAASLIDAYKEANPDWSTIVPTAWYNMEEGLIHLKEET